MHLRVWYEHGTKVQADKERSGSSETAISNDGDAYFSLETVLLIKDSVNFATNVDCLCALFHTFAMRIFFIAFDFFSI